MQKIIESLTQEEKDILDQDIKNYNPPDAASKEDKQITGTFGH
jgi:hypothetical protein